VHHQFYSAAHKPDSIEPCWQGPRTDQEGGHNYSSNPHVPAELQPHPRKFPTFAALSTEAGWAKLLFTLYPSYSSTLQQHVRITDPSLLLTLHWWSQGRVRQLVGCSTSGCSCYQQYTDAAVQWGEPYCHVQFCNRMSSCDIFMHESLF